MPLLSAAEPAGRPGGRIPISMSERKRVKAKQEGEVRLTVRETQVVRLLARGCTYSQVADELGTSIHTVGMHVKNAYLKLDVHNAPAAVMRAIRLGLIEL